MLRGKQIIRKIDDMMADPARYGIRACLLCGTERIHVASVYEAPNQDLSQRLGGEKGATIYVGFALCNECVDLPDREAKIEAEIINRYQVH